MEHKMKHAKHRTFEVLRRDFMVLAACILLLFLTSTIMSKDFHFLITTKKENKEAMVIPKKPLTCDLSSPRSEVCELDGEILVRGNVWSSIEVEADDEYFNNLKSRRNLRRLIRPYARLIDKWAMNKARVVDVAVVEQPSINKPQCEGINHRNVPGIVFSIGGHTGNIFHDYSDVLIPLYLTSLHYKGEVKFIITDMRSWFIAKHQHVLNRLTNYEIIDFDNDNREHCFTKLTVGLICHKDFRIDPNMHPLGFSMTNFTHFLRTSYALERHVLTTGELKTSGRRPRLMIIARKWTRSITNSDAVVDMAKELGYDVVVTEAGDDNTTTLAEFAELVNSCDVLLGVHGAGLTNLIFLPMNATMLQVVPCCEMEGPARFDYGMPAIESGIRYLHYVIDPMESTLVDKYGIDHPYIKDPQSVHKQGWTAVRDVYLRQQNVKLNLTRFRPFLLKAIEHLL